MSTTGMLEAVHPGCGRSVVPCNLVRCCNGCAGLIMSLQLCALPVIVVKPLNFVSSCIRLQKAGPNDAGQMYNVNSWACAQTGLDPFLRLASLRAAALFGDFCLENTS